MKKMILIFGLLVSCFLGNAATKNINQGVLLLVFQDRHCGDRFSGEWEKALPIFKKYNAHASFFFIGKFDGAVSNALKKIVADGHSTGAKGLVNIYDLPRDIKVKGERDFLDNNIAEQRKLAKAFGVSLPPFFYPGPNRSDAVDEMLLTRFDRICFDNNIRKFGMPTNDVKPLVTDERMFFPVKDLPNRRFLSGVKLGEALRTDIDDLLACVRRAGERKEVVMFYSHGIKEELKDQHMKIEWLERLLAEAKKCGVRVLGLNELPDVVIPDEKKFYSATLPKNTKTLEIGPTASIKTLEAALEKVAELRAKDIKTPIALRVASADYTPIAPLEITKKHASTDFAPLFIYANDFTKLPRINSGWPWNVTNNTAAFKIVDGGNCTIAGFDMTGSGDGVRIENASQVNVLGCDIRNVGCHGIYVNAKDKKDILLENNHIYEVGRSDDSSAGIRIVQITTGVTARNNFIHDVPSSAISGFGRGCEISYNRIVRSNMKVPETGVIAHFERPSSLDTKICYNWISDIRTNGVSGILITSGVDRNRIIGNHIERCRSAGVEIQGSRNIVISNNVFVSCGALPVTSNTVQFVLKNDVAGVKTLSNIFYYPDQEKGLYMQLTGINIRANEFNNNIVWGGDNEPPRVLTSKSTASWLEWRATGADRRSLMASPMFISPATRYMPVNTNYRLHDESVAFNRGFTSLPYDKIGLVESLVRPSLPDKNIYFKK